MERSNPGDAVSVLSPAVYNLYLFFKEGCLVGQKYQFFDCSAAIRDSSGGWVLNSAIMPPAAIPPAANRDADVDRTAVE